MTHDCKTTGLASVAALAVGALMAFAPMKAEAATVNLDTDSSFTVTQNTFTGGIVNYTIAPDLNSGDDYILGFPVNIQNATETQFDFVVSGSGTLSIDLYVDPFINGGVGTADVRLGTRGSISGDYSAQWGNGPDVDLTDGNEKWISTSFAGSGPSNAQTLFFEWSGITVSRQTDAGVAPVPLPAAGWLMIAGLGGLAAMRRRKRAA
jgi:hypothetical protein